MKRKYFLIFLFLGLIIMPQSCSCEPEIINNRRILIKGNLVDSNNNPVANISVRCATYNSILGETVSDANGNFQFTSLLIEDNYSYDIKINTKPYGYYSGQEYHFGNGYFYGSIENQDYSAKKYFNNTGDRSFSTHDLSVVQLNKAANLTVLFSNNPEHNNMVSYKFEYDSAICLIDLSANTPEECQVINNNYNQIDINTASFETILQSQLGSNVIIKYILNNEPEQVITIPLTNTENTYVFEF